MTGRLATCVAGIALVVTAACSGKKNPEEASPGKPAEAGSAAGKARGSGAADAPKRAAITAKSLSPVVIHELGADNVVPTAIVIELAAPVIDREAIGSPSPATNLKITPATAGELVHSGVSELTFTPSRPFDFDTTYQVELAGVDTLDGPIAAAAGEHGPTRSRPRRSSSSSWAPSDIDLDHHKITMDIAFSGAVLPNLARAAMQLTVDGKVPAGVAIQRNRDGSHVVVALSDPQIALGARLALGIKGTLASLTGVRAPAASAEYIVSSDKAVSIKTAAVVEGATGFYLEVVCDDSAARKGHRGYYEGEGYYDLSERCQLSDDAIKHIHFDAGGQEDVHHGRPRRVPGVRRVQARRLQGEDRRRRDLGRRRRGAGAVHPVVLGGGAQAAAVVRGERPLPAAQRVDQPRDQAHQRRHREPDRPPRAGGEPGVLARRGRATRRPSGPAT